MKKTNIVICTLILIGFWGQCSAQTVSQPAPIKSTTKSKSSSSAFGSLREEAASPVKNSSTDPVFRMPKKLILDVEPAAEQIINEITK